MKTELITALDFSNEEDALCMVRCLGNTVSFYKIGLELFIASGYTLVPKLKDLGKKVFLDLKIHDIPNTAVGAVKSCLKLGADIIDVHAQGGVDMMRRAKEAVDTYAGAVKPLLIGVTLLTSLDKNHLQDMGIKKSEEDYVLTLAELVKKAGLFGVVASVLETQKIKALYEDFICVTPGIRLNTDKNDQLRTGTPQDAKAAGCNYIVVGRPITKSQDPKRMAEVITKMLA